LNPQIGAFEKNGSADMNQTRARVHFDTTWTGSTGSTGFNVRRGFSKKKSLGNLKPQIIAPRVTPLEGVSTYVLRGIRVRGVENPQGFSLMNADAKSHSGANIYRKKRSCFAFFAYFAVKLQDIYQHFNIFFWARGHVPDAADMNESCGVSQIDQIPAPGQSARKMGRRGWRYSVVLPFILYHDMLSFNIQ
jgi:hypothetical protein